MTFVKQTAPNLDGQAEVNLRQNDFDAAIWNKGYRVYHDKAIMCACRNKADRQPLSNCQNCGGSGWVFADRTQTRMLVQSINLDTKFKEWSQERIGTSKVSAMSRDQLGFMDRITLIDGQLIHTQILFPTAHSDSVIRARLDYELVEVEAVYLFEGSTKRLKKLTVGTDYTIVDNIWVEIDDVYSAVEDLTISIRYKHQLAFHVIDLARGMMSSPVTEGNTTVYKDFPISATARLAHYVLDGSNYQNNYLFDNSNITCDSIVVFEINKQFVTAQALTQTEIDALDLTAFKYNVVFNTTTAEFYIRTGATLTKIDWPTSIRKIATVNSTVPDAFITGTCNAFIEVALTSGDLNLNSWTPTGLADEAIVQVKKDSGAGNIIFGATTITTAGDILILQWDSNSSTFSEIT